MNPIRSSVIAALTLASGMVSATEGDLDLSFDGDGKQTVVFDGTALAFSASVTSGNAIYLVGAAQGEKLDTPYGIAIARLLKDGAPDETYDGDGKVFYQPYLGDTFMRAAAIQADGKLVVAGSAVVDTFPQDEYDMVVCRFDTVGIPDPEFGDAETPGCRAISFDLDDESTDFAESLLIQDDGKIVVVGSASENGLSRAVIARLRPNGSTDNTGPDAFGENGRVVLLPDAPSSAGLTDVTQASGGRLVASGTYSVNIDAADMLVFRLEADGSLDDSLNGVGVVQIAFDIGPAGFRRDEASAVHVFGDDSILVAGSAERGPGDVQMAVAKLTPEGAPDTSLDGDGKVAPMFCDACAQARALDMVVQADGRIVLAGPVNVSGAEEDFGIMQLMANGGDDDSFGDGGRAFVEFNLDGASRDIAHSVVLQNGRIVVAGAAEAPGIDTNVFAVARLESDLIFADGFGFDDE